jgi:hypothetical protein
VTVDCQLTRASVELLPDRRPADGAGEEGDVTSSGAADEWDLVVPANGDELLAELGRHGVRPGQRVHLRAVPDVGEAETTAAWPDDLATALDQAAAAKRPPFRPVEGMLARLGPAPTWEDFEEASRLAAADAEASGTLPE